MCLSVNDGTDSSGWIKPDGRLIGSGVIRFAVYFPMQNSPEELPQQVFQSHAPKGKNFDVYLYGKDLRFVARNGDCYSPTIAKSVEVPVELDKWNEVDVAYKIGVDGFWRISINGRMDFKYHGATQFVQQINEEHGLSYFQAGCRVGPGNWKQFSDIQAVRAFIAI